jgi:hypothetical protein
LSDAWSIEVRSPDPVAHFAARELQQGLQRMGGPALQVRPWSDGPRILLSCGAEGDAFTRSRDQQGLALRGAGSRGLLYAVYELLEALGCRWIGPGAAGECWPQYSAVTLPAGGMASQPALTGRCLVLGQDVFLAEAEDWIVWAARNRINTVFVHVTDQWPALLACHLATWRRRRAALLPLLCERGMRLELGGHLLSNLLPRRLFRHMPQAFRFDGEQRTSRFNFCPSSPQALAELRRRGRAFVRRFPEAHVYHFWPDDLPGGGWCACPQCAALAPADQALLAANELADMLAVARPEARLSFLAYHDTAGPAPVVRPHANLLLTYAPRLRSYAAGIAESANERNRPCWQDLRAAQAVFQDAAGTQVFEYYLDGILFKSALPPLPQIIQADLRAYAAAGMQQVSVLLTSDRPWLATPLNAYLFARLAWDPDQDPCELVATYAAGRTPQAAGELLQVYQAWSELWQPALDLRPAEQGMTAAVGRPRLAQPPADVLDYMATERLLRERRLEHLSRIEPLIANGEAAWQAFLAKGASLPVLVAEYAEWDASVRLLRLLLARQELYVLEDRRASRASLRQALRQARQTLAGVRAWGDRHLPQPQQRAAFLLFRMLPQLHLDAVEDRCLAQPLRRVGLRLRAYSRIAWYLLWLR